MKVFFAAVTTPVILIVKRLRKKPKKEDVCSECNSDCGECGFNGQIKEG